jgi:hypothetical protein
VVWFSKPTPVMKQQGIHTQWTNVSFQAVLLWHN